MNTNVIFEVYTPSPGAFLVTRNGKVVDNWRELQPLARKAVEPALRDRWQRHWQDVSQQATRCVNAEELDILMSYVYTPNMYYPCPDELAARALVKQAIS